MKVMAALVATLFKQTKEGAGHRRVEYGSVDNRATLNPVALHGRLF